VLGLDHASTALKHFRHVNGWTSEQTSDYFRGVWALWRQRSQRDWTLDLSLLADYGIEPPTEAELAQGKDRWR
jgi:hypothetical protein